MWSLSLVGALSLGGLVSSVRAVSKQCDNYSNMCVEVRPSGSEVEYILSSLKSYANTGWMAIGFGSHMLNTEMVISWVNEDGTVTVSHRKTSSYVMPQPNSSPSHVAKLVKADLRVAKTDKPVIAFTMPTPAGPSVDLIWGFGALNPGSSDPSATIMPHVNMGRMTLDLPSSQSPSNSSSGSSVTATSSPARPTKVQITAPPPKIEPWLPYQRKIIAHAVFSTAGFLVLLPIGALIGRLGRTFTPAWFASHWVANFALSAPAILVGISFGIASVYDANAQEMKSTHKRVGFLLCFLYALQITLGAAIHWIKLPSQVASGRRPVQNYAHAVSGLFIIALAFFQVRTGYSVELPKYAGFDAPRLADAAWTTWAVAIPLFYVAGLALLPRQWFQEAAAHARLMKKTDMRLKEYDS